MTRVFAQARKLRSVSYDLWKMTHEFARDVKSDLSNFEVDGKCKKLRLVLEREMCISQGEWPGIIDEFVETLRPRPEAKRRSGEDD